MRSQLPPGTRLLSEEERLETLKNLSQSIEEIKNVLGEAEVRKILETMPLSLKTLSMRKQKEELERKLDEIDKAIDTFSRKNVYIADN